MRKITLFIASLFLTIGAMAQVVADGVYTIQADENGKRGYLAASASHARPVLTEISWSDYAGNSCTDIVENGKLWCVKNVDGVAYICNLGNGMFIEDNGTDDILFGAPSAFNITQHNSYIHVGSGEGIRYLSMGCGATAPSQVKWEKGNANDGGCLLTFKAVEGDYSAQIAAVEKNLERSKKYVSYGVYTVSNNFNNRGTLAYGTYNGTEYFGLADITLSGYADRDVAVENAANAVWYTVETEKGRYIYNVGKGLFLQNATQTNATCAAEVATGFTYEVRTNGSNSYVSIKDGDYYLSCSPGYYPNQGQVRWLTSDEEAATLLTLTSVTPFAYADAMAAADAAIAEFEAPELEAFVPSSVSVYPTDGYSFNSIRVWFDESIVVNGENYGAIFNENGDKVVDLVYSLGGTGSKYLTVKAPEAITAPGNYKVVINAGVIFNADGTKEYKGGEFEFTVAERGVEIESIYAPDAEVTSMRNCLDYEITINYYNTVEVDAEKSVIMTVGETTYTAEVTAAEESWGYVISIAFDAEAEYAEGDYTLTIPAGLYTVNGTPNAEEVYEFTYAKPAPITAEVSNTGVVESLSEFEVTFSALVNAWELYVTDGDGNMYMFCKNDEGKFILTDPNTWNPAEPITKPGVYTLNFLTDNSYLFESSDAKIDPATAVFTWTIEGVTTAIDSVNVQAENAVIYDLTGRRVEKITNAGIYVINGVKKVVK